MDWASHRSSKWLWLFGGLFLVALGVAVANEWYPFLLLPFALGLVFITLLRLDITLILIAFFTPLSVLFEIDALGAALILPTEPLMIGVLILFVLKFIYEGGHLPDTYRNPIVWIVVGMILWMLITSLTSSLPLVSFKALLSRLWFTVTFFFLGLELFKNPKAFPKYLWAYASGMLIVVTYTIIHHAIMGFDKDAAHWVMSPFFKDHTSYGAILAFLIPPFIALFVNEQQSSQRKWWVGLVLFIFIVATILSYTRAAWLSLFAAFLVFAAVKLRIPFRLIAAVSVAALALLWVFQDDLMMKLEKNNQDSSGNIAEHVQSMTNVSTDASNLERLNRWGAALRMWRARPIIGWGPGTYQFQYAPFQLPSEKTVISTNNADMGNAHSEYFGPLSEQGILGMLWVILLVGWSVARGLTMAVYHADSTTRNLLLGVTAGLITYWVHGLLNNFLDTDKASVLVWGFTAFIVILDVEWRKTQKNQKSDANRAGTPTAAESGD